MNQLDLDAPVWILGKGPSARRITDDMFGYVAAINEASTLCDRLHWQFINDWLALLATPVASLERATSLVLPRYLHMDPQGEHVIRWAEALHRLRASPARVELYKLWSDPHPLTGLHLPDFGELHSTAETAVAWLLGIGFRRFVTLGIDPAGGYHDTFYGGQQDETKTDTWYVTNWKRICRRVEKAGGRIERG